MLLSLLQLTSEDDAEEEALSGVVDLQSGCKLQCLPQAAKAFTVWVAGRSITLKVRALQTLCYHSRHAQPAR